MAFWYNDVTVLYSDDKLTDFFPKKEDNLTDNLNSIMRFGIYVCILISVYYKDIKYLYLISVFAVLTIYVYNQNESKTEGYANIYDFLSDNKKKDLDLPPKKCRKPTEDNPYMNFTMADYLDTDANGTIKKKDDPCITEPEKVKEMYYRGSTDEKGVRKAHENKVFSNFDSDQRFHSIPQHDHQLFMDYVYKNEQVCKVDPKSCKVYNDIRFRRKN